MKGVHLNPKAQNLKRILAYVIFFAISFIFSMVFSDLYTLGDQAFYTSLYDSLETAKIWHIPILQRAHTGSVEPLYGLTAWTGAHLLEKRWWFSIFNGILAILLLVFVRKFRASPLLYPLIFSNFYFFVLMFSAERLKLAVICAILYAIIDTKRRYVFAIASILYHFQATLFAIPIISERITILFRLLLRGRLRPRSIIFLSFLCVSVFLIGALFQDTISGKFAHYSEEPGNSGLAKMLVFSVVGIAFSRNRMAAVLTFSALSVIVSIIGGERVVIVAFFLAIIPTFAWKRGLNPITIPLLLYFSWKGVWFLQEVGEFGKGMF